LSETKITVIYDNPIDPGAFEAAYESEQLEAARRIPGHIRFEASKVWPRRMEVPRPLTVPSTSTTLITLQPARR
jgi:hypothetical protein